MSDIDPEANRQADIIEERRKRAIADDRMRAAEAAVAFAVQSAHEIGRLVISLSTSRDVGDLPKAEASERCILNLCHGICATDCGTALLAELAEAKKDAELVDWLEKMVVNVRVPLVHGSRDLFWSSPEEDDGEVAKSDIRARIHAAIAQKE